MGFGLWAALSVGTLALSLPVPILYHYPTLGLALLVAVFSTTVGLSFAAREEKGLAGTITASLAVGGSLAAIPFLGIAAMRVTARIEYRWGFAVGAVFVFLLVMILALKALQGRELGFFGKGIRVLPIGSAIPMMSFISMGAVRFYLTTAPPDLAHTVGRSSISIAAIAGTAFLILLGAVIASALEGLFESQEAVVEKAQEGELFFRSLSEAIPGMIWTARPDGHRDFFNKRWCDYTGLTVEQGRGWGWMQAFHPEDVEVARTHWQRSMLTGEPYQVECRLRAKDGSYRWFLGRGNPIRDGTGQIIKWFGMVTDIEHQKQNQQILEEQIRERTEQLAEANTRLQEEMWDKDMARKQLDEQNERMMRELSERSQRATLLTKMGEHLQSCVNQKEVFAAALGFAPKIFVHPGAIALLNSERNLAEVIGSWANCELPRKAFEPNACWALRTGHQHLVVAGDPTARCAHAAGVEHTYLCVPILAQGEALGIMHFQSTDESASLAEAELSFKTTFAGQVGLSIANINLRDALRIQSIKDTLTGLYNRRYMEEMLDREIRRAARAHQSLGILMLDLDHFKTFNDTYGHDAGDAVLCEAASLLTKSVRAEDTVCRFGGEEFVVLLPTANLQSARERAEVIRSKLKSLTVLFRGQSLGVITASIGVCAFPVNGASPQELLTAVDAALYCAKREGRDRVVIAEQPPAVSSETATAAGQKS